MKRILLIGGLVAAVGAFMVFTLAASPPSPVGKYKIILDNAFGLTSGADFKVAGVPAGKIQTIELKPGCINGGGSTVCQAVVNVDVTLKGFDHFRSDAFCESRPQSLIGEYFIECQPGTKGKVLPPGSTIPVQNTESTIPFDLVNNIQEMPYRQRLSLIINELGAAVAGRSGDLEAALRRAVPALTQTDNLLNLLANDSKTLQHLTSDSNTVVTALARNSGQVQRFIDEANKAATTSATQAGNISATWAKLPGFLEQLKPTMAKLGTAADANEPVLRNLLATAGQLRTLFTNLAPCSQPHSDSQCGFADASLPSLQALGKASVVGKPAIEAAAPTIRHLNQMTGGTGCLSHDLNLDAAGHGAGGAHTSFVQTCLPELAQNLAIVTHDLDNPARAVEPDSRSPGGKGFSGLEALLWYVFVQPLSINTYSKFGHMLNVNAFIDPRCSPYATPQSIANGLQAFGPAYRQCYAFLGPNQPGVNQRDPSNSSACVPDPGGEPPGEPGPSRSTSPCRLGASPKPKSADTPGAQASADTGARSSSGSPGSTPAGGGGSPPKSGVAQTLSRLVSVIDGGSSSGANASSPTGATSSASAAAPRTGGSSTAAPGTGGSPHQAQQLLNYLLAP